VPRGRVPSRFVVGGGESVIHRRSKQLDVQGHGVTAISEIAVVPRRIDPVVVKIERRLVGRAVALGYGHYKPIDFCSARVVKVNLCQLHS